ncbi:hypothetical protein BDW62DRAFT_171339 [Aspergillus aurantiobrunneus]
MDALIMPVSPWSGCERFGLCYDNYTSLWNVLDYCVVGLPVGGVGGVEDEGKGGYEAGRVNGAPVGVQIVGRRLQEEYLLQTARVCDEAVKASRG